METSTRGDCNILHDQSCRPPYQRNRGWFVRVKTFDQSMGHKKCMKAVIERSSTFSVSIHYKIGRWRQTKSNEKVAGPSVGRASEYSS